jgi:serine/threonine protein kinase
MAWPNPNEYAEAIQNPKQAFSVPELQHSEVVTNKMGLPRPISGNFATVFEVKSGGTKLAVRCFLREITNQQARYTAISKHLKAQKLSCMVGFEYLQQGIKVKGQWYPILKMDWTEGSRLDLYLEKNIQNPENIRNLAQKWNVLAKQLQQTGIAHGDLQHGNILITAQRDIKLIDYDGVFISEVIGLPSHEIGHRHYQHPSRSSDKNVSLANYKNIDNFSSAIIWFSLYALSIDGSLWQSTKAGEENLLFRDSD